MGVFGGIVYPPRQAYAATNLIFPVIGPNHYSDDYLASRGDHLHHAIDIIAGKGQKLVAVQDGTLVDVQYPEPSWGYSITIESDSGWQYRYIHINDDTPGTNDGKGGGKHAYAMGIMEGNRVRRGQLVGWVGDSGNSNGVSHLHFEKYKPDHSVTNPYNSLRQASVITTPKTAVIQPDEVAPNGEAKTNLNVDVGNTEGDVLQETIVGNRGGAEPRVRVYDANRTMLHSFLAYDADFVNGIDVAACDIDGDTFDEVIAGPGKGHDPTVRMFEPDGTLINSIQAYDLAFQGGVWVGCVDLDNDGTDEIITGEKAGGEPRVRVFKADGTQLLDFLATDPSFTGGIDVAGGDITGDDNGEIVIGIGSGAAPEVKTFAADGTPIISFLAYTGASYDHGVRLGVGNVRQWTDKDEIVTVPASQYVPAARMFDGDGNKLDTDYFWEEWWYGYYDIGAGDGLTKASSGTNRRGSVRLGVD